MNTQPLQNLVKFITRTDTTTLEYLSGFTALLFGWSAINFATGGTSTPTSEWLTRLLPIETWVVVLFGGGALQMWARYKNHVQLRVVTAFFAMLTWSLLAFGSIITGGSGYVFTGPLTLIAIFTYLKLAWGRGDK